MEDIRTLMWVSVQDSLPVHRQMVLISTLFAHGKQEIDLVTFLEEDPRVEYYAVTLGVEPIAYPRFSYSGGDCIFEWLLCENFVNNENDSVVTHWMPLPQFPEIEGGTQMAIQNLREKSAEQEQRGGVLNPIEMFLRLHGKEHLR